MIPNVGKELLEEALRKFDREERDLPAWANWQENGNHRYAIEHDGKQYPVKHIVSLATAVPKSQFSGGNEANRYVSSRGFRVVPLTQPQVEIPEFDELLRRICELQKSYNSSNTPAMKERGDLVRKQAPAVLKSWLPPDSQLEVSASDGIGQKSRVPWFRVFDRARSRNARDGYYLVYLFAADGSSVALSLNQGTTTGSQGNLKSRSAQEIKEGVAKARSILDSKLSGTNFVDEITLRDPKGLGDGYERGHIVGYSYPSEKIPTDATLRDDFSRMLSLLGQLYSAEVTSQQTSTSSKNGSTAAHKSLVHHIIDAVETSGFVFEPWQVAAFVTAVRTKPFVILAGISGTGKTKLPIIAGEATGAAVNVIPVRPDWNDSGDILGYTDISGRFRPQELLKLCRKASDNPAVQHFAVIDEMNIARVEHYFAEVLSRIEDSSMPKDRPRPLVLSGGEGYQDYAEVGLPLNVAIVGTVNMDESTHGFSKKVLDRAFTLELSEVDLSRILSVSAFTTKQFASSSWRGSCCRLGQLITGDPAQDEWMEGYLAQLQDINIILSRNHLQVGYRTRDEILLFVHNSQSELDSFVDGDGNSVDPFDLALMTKVLPRIAGGTRAVERILDELLSLCASANSPEDTLNDWLANGSPHRIEGAKWPRTAARLCLMKHRLEEGYTSYFL